MIALILAALVGSSLGSTEVVPTVTLIQGPVFQAASTNTVWPATNVSFGIVGSSNATTGATSGKQYSITAGSNLTFIEFNNFTPSVASYVNGQTVWVTNGMFQFRMSYQDTNGARFAYSSALDCGYLSGNYTTFEASNFLAGTMGHTLVTNITATTNSGRDGTLWDSISLTGWTWHTNSIFYGATGYTGLSQMNSIYVNPTAFPWKFTAITRRHAYSAGHVFGSNATNGNVLFVGSDGVTNSMFVNQCRSRNQLTPFYDDYCIVMFTNDLPATVQPLRVCLNTNFLYKFPLGKLTFTYPALETCQHGNIGSQTTPLFNNHPMPVSGDSGNPVLFLWGNEIINYGGTSGSLLSSNMVNDMNAMTLAAGLSTNTYQPVYFTEITNFTNYYP